MNGLPPDLDLQFLVGRQLEQLCLGEHHVRLSFDADVSVDIEGEFSLDEVRHGVRDAHLMHVLLGRSVAKAERVAPGDLALEVGSHKLVVHDSNEAYESYALQSGTEVTVV